VADFKKVVCMADISPVSLSNLNQAATPISSITSPAARATGSAAGSESAAKAQRAEDEVEFSGVVTYLNRLRQLPEVRQEIVDRVKQEIAQGTYDAPEKFDAALEELLLDFQEREHLGF
jgi:negative regulator of flagellin synthesis FlgM